MSNRVLAYIIKDQQPVLQSADQTVRDACQSMWQRRVGSVLVVDGHQHLVGIFTGRDAVRFLSSGADAAAAPLADTMTPNPVSIAPDGRAIDALRLMSEGGFRHIPVIEDRRIWGVVSRGDFKGMEFEDFHFRNSGRLQSSTNNRELRQVIEGQHPILYREDDTVQQACDAMWTRKVGSVLVADTRQKLAGILTGRDVVRLLVNTEHAATQHLATAMTSNPQTIRPDGRAIDALHVMSDHGFRHLPVVEDGKILGVVSRGDFTGIEVDRLDEEEHLWECIR